MPEYRAARLFLALYMTRNGYIDVMPYPRVKPRAAKSTHDTGVYADLDALIRLQYKATGFSFLPRQPMHSILAGRHASRLRARGLNFEEIRRYLPGDDIRAMDWKVTARL